MNWSEILCSNIRSAKIERNFPLAQCTTMGIGGNAEFYIEAEEIEDIKNIKFLENSEGLKLKIIGGGSNLLIRDGTIEGLFLSTRRLKGITLKDAGDSFALEVKAGTPLRDVIARTFSLSAEGLEHLVGIPGTVGGALAGNAGGKGFSISDNVVWVETVNSRGMLCRWAKDEVDWGYRSSSLTDSGNIIVSCSLCVKKGSIDRIRERLSFFWKIRGNQPYEYKSAGCIFRNPKGHAAGKLLDDCKCKGLRRGDAQVSTRHANFIINTGNASFKDVTGLINECRKRVKESKGIDLELEVRLLND